MSTTAQILARGLDMLLDPRLAQAAPYNAWRAWRYAAVGAGTATGGPLQVCLTFDVEQDYRDPAGSSSARRFLDSFPARARAHGWRTTLYTQGSLLPELAAGVADAAAEHEIGLHGLYHEVWGRSRWWQYRLGYAEIPGAEKKARLDEALGRFEQAGIATPRTFRAPYLNAGRETLRLLARRGFSSDSSPASYHGALPLPRLRADLWQVPVTTDPRPVRRGSLAHYPELTLGEIVGTPLASALRTANAAVRLQKLRRSPLPPHIVILAHPWEFEQTAGVPYSGAGNWDRLTMLLDGLAAAYDLRFVTVSELIAAQ